MQNRLKALQRQYDELKEVKKVTEANVITGKLNSKSDS